MTYTERLAVTSGDVGVSLGEVVGVVAWSVVSADVVSSEASEAPAAIGIVAMTAMATLKTVRRLRADVATVGFGSIFMRFLPV
jgi:hypothetical protein